MREALPTEMSLVAHLIDELALPNTDNNPAERALRGLAIGRKNYLVADADDERAAAMYSLIELPSSMASIQSLLACDVLTRIADHPNNRLSERKRCGDPTFR